MEATRLKRVLKIMNIGVNTVGFFGKLTQPLSRIELKHFYHFHLDVFDRYGTICLQWNLHDYNTCCVDFLYTEAGVVFRDFNSAAAAVERAIAAQSLTAANFGKSIAVVLYFHRRIHFLRF